MKRYYLNFRVMLVTFAFGSASVEPFQSFSKSGILRPEPISAVIIVPVEEKETRSRTLENDVDVNRCGGWPVLDFENVSKKNNGRGLKRKSSKKQFKKITRSKNFPE